MRGTSVRQELREMPLTAHKTHRSGYYTYDMFPKCHTMWLSSATTICYTVTNSIITINIYYLLTASTLPKIISTSKMAGEERRYEGCHRVKE